MYENAKDDDDLEEIAEDINEEDSGDLELQEMKNQIGKIDQKINYCNERLGLTKKNI